MSVEEKMIPAGSQTVGPYFRIGLQYLIDRMEARQAGIPGAISIQGRVLERDGNPVPDAMLEFWCVGDEIHDGVSHHMDGLPDGFRRVATAEDGSFAVAMRRPTSMRLDDGSAAAPHLMVLVFARGLLRHLITRVYFEGDHANDSDPVLLAVPAERRSSLVAKREKESLYRWDVILQGEKETVFFAW